VIVLQDSELVQYSGSTYCCPTCGSAIRIRKVVLPVQRSTTTVYRPPSPGRLLHTSLQTPNFRVDIGWICIDRLCCDGRVFCYSRMPLRKTDEQIAYERSKLDSMWLASVTRSSRFALLHLRSDLITIDFLRRYWGEMRRYHDLVRLVTDRYQLPEDLLDTIWGQLSVERRFRIIANSKLSGEFIVRHWRYLDSLERALVVSDDKLAGADISVLPILLVDDDEVVRQYAREKLAQAMGKKVERKYSYQKTFMMSNAYIEEFLRKSNSISI